MTVNCPVESPALLPVYGSRPLMIERGEGCYVFDAEGRRYLDFLTGIGVNALGYNHPAITAAIRDQAPQCLHTSNLFAHRFQGELAERLTAWSGLDFAFFSNSGTEAMEAALKGARALANRNGRSRHRIIALENGFHGRTAASLAVTSRAAYREPFLPLTPDTVFVPANDIDALHAAANEDTIAIVAEPIQGEGGIHPLTPAYLAALEATAADRDALWIADETQCGLGRTGSHFAYQDFDVPFRPDIVVTAKPLGGGLPVGATLFNRRAASAIGPGMHGTTFGGGPLACRTALAFLAETERLQPYIRQHGAYLHGQLQEIAAASLVVKEVRGRGLMAGIELDRPAAPYAARALEQGLIVNATHGSVLRLLPPYIAGTREIDEACAILRAVLTS